VQDRILNHADRSVSAIDDRHRYDAEARAWPQSSRSAGETFRKTRYSGSHRRPTGGGSTAARFRVLDGIVFGDPYGSFQGRSTEPTSRRTGIERGHGFGGRGVSMSS
jgi:hypothetical protein